MNRTSFFFRIVCLLSCTLAPLSPAAAQETPAAAQETPAVARDPNALTDEQKRDNLQRARKSLEIVAPFLNDETRAQLPLLREILERVATDPDTATTDEIRIAREIRQMAVEANEGRGGRISLAELKARMQKTAVPKPILQSGETRVPGGGTVGYVYLVVNGKKKKVAEIPSRVGALRPAVRARIVQRRIETAAAKDAHWAARLKAKQLRGQWVVAAPSAPDGYILTADSAFARLRQTTPQKLALRLVDLVRLSLGTAAFAGRAGGSAEEIAAEMRAEGDAAYGAGDGAEAESRYKAALECAPNYTLPYLRLAALYHERKNATARDAIRTRAMGRANLSASERAELQRYR